MVAETPVLDTTPGADELTTVFVGNVVGCVAVFVTEAGNPFGALPEFSASTGVPELRFVGAVGKLVVVVATVLTVTGCVGFGTFVATTPAFVVTVPGVPASTVLPATTGALLTPVGVT